MPRRADTLFPPDPDELKTVEQVAKATGRSPGSILEYVRQGVLPAIDQHVPGQRGRPRKMIRAGDIINVAFRPRWEKRRAPIQSKSGAVLKWTSLPDDTAEEGPETE